jgi:colanic acid/amylovoran biosynthesis protein WcaK/AmsJ
MPYYTVSATERKSEIENILGNEEEIHMKVLLTNVYSYKNKGDAAIVFSMLQEINRVFDAPDIIIQTTDPRNDKGKYGVPVRSTLLWTLLSSVRDQPMPLRMLVLARGLARLGSFLTIRRLLGWRPYFLLSRDLRGFIADIDDADLVIGCGGVYLNSPDNSPPQTVLLLVTCLNLLAAKWCGKTVYLYSQSIGPVYGRLQRRLLRFTLNRVDLIEPRETISRKLLEGLRPKTRIVATADAALLLGRSGRFPHDKLQLRPERLHVGLTVRNWFARPADFAAYTRAVAKVIDYLITKHHAEVFYVPQVIADNFGDDDRTAARAVWQQVHHQQYFTVIESDLHPFEVIGICGQMDLFIGTRMHSNIFALINHVPVVAIAYEHKTRGIMRGLGIEDLAINIQDVTYQSLKDKVDLLLAKPDYFKQQIADNLPGQIAESRKAMDTIKGLHEQRELSDTSPA